MATKYLFVSYVREDLDRIRPLLDQIKYEFEFRALPVQLWVDVSNLQPGEQWNVAIGDALQSSIGFLFFVSPRSLKSEWVFRELSIAGAVADRLIIPVLLHRPLELPPILAEHQWLDMSGLRSPEQIKAAASRIVEATEHYLITTPQPRAAVASSEAPIVAADIAQQLRSSTEPTVVEVQNNSVFVVHGHSTEPLTKLEMFLTSVGIEAIVLSRQNESPQSLFQKFMSVAKQARFAIVLLCADDYGVARRQYEADGVGERALQFRARQNVILELGFFYGRLGWENVSVLHQDPERVYPNFERPSDLDGVVFDSISSHAWQKNLGAKLLAAGFKLSRSI